jgi:hypothetical protein
MGLENGIKHILSYDLKVWKGEGQESATGSGKGKRGERQA